MDWMVDVDVGCVDVRAWCVVVDIVECGVVSWYVVSGFGVGGVGVGSVAILVGVNIGGVVLGGGSMCGGGLCSFGGGVGIWVWCLLLLSKCLALLMSSIFLAKFYFP